MVLRPSIVVNNRHMHEVTDDAIRAIIEGERPSNNIPPRGAPPSGSAGTRRVGPSLRLSMSMRSAELWTRVAVWLSIKVDRDGAIQERPEYPPVAIVRDVLGRPSDGVAAPCTDRYRDVTDTARGRHNPRR